MNSIPSTQAIVVTSPGSVEIQTFPSRALQKGELRVANTITAVSVGTEYLAVSGKLHSSSFPSLVGYQGVGRIMEIGPETLGYVVGERVCSGLSLWQPEGYGQGSGNGHQSHPIVSCTGDFAQSELVRIPQKVSDEEASYAWLAAVSMQGVERAGVKPGDVVAVVGLGVVGQFAAQICRARGARVYARDLQEDRVSLALKYSADVAVAGGVEALNARLRQDVRGGATVVIECTGNTQVLDSAIELAGFMGRVVLQGHYPGDVKFRFVPAHHRRLTLVLPCAWGDLRPVLALMKEKKLTVAPWIAGTFTPDQAGQLYRRIHDRDPSLSAALVRWDAL